MKHIIKFSMFFLAVVSTYFVGRFTHMVAPPIVAVGAALSLVATYVGLAFADIPARRREQATWVARVAMGIEAVYGTLYVLSEQTPSVFAAPMSLWLSIPLAILHGSVFSVLLYFVSLFIVHERGETEAPTLADQRDQLMIETITTLRDVVQQQRLLPAASPVMELPDTKAEMIRRLAQMQIDQGVPAHEISSVVIATATGYNKDYVQQVVSRWRGEQR